jgi:hypothetical protein
VRQLTNQLEFLKAQLASEQATIVEIKAANEVDLRKVDDLRVEFRLKMQEADKRREEVRAYA